jgi:hypothetical protein
VVSSLIVRRHLAAVPGDERLRHGDDVLLRLVAEEKKPPVVFTSFSSTSPSGVRRRAPAPWV